MAILASPVPQPNRVTSGYHATRAGGRSHGGLDFAVPEGTPVYSVFPGVVRSAGDSGQYPGAGIMVTVDHDVGGHKATSRYLHLSKVLVKKGDKLGAKTELGKSGATGARSPHLHLDVLIDKGSVPAWESRFGRPPGGWVVHSSGKYKIPLETLVPIDAGAEGLLIKKPALRSEYLWVLAILLLLSDN